MQNPLFRPAPRLDPGGEEIAFSFEGRAMRAPAGATVAAALLVNGVRAFRESPVSGAPRGPFCMMGACFECLVEIDGRADRQACGVELAAGMVVRRQRRPDPAS